MPIRPPVFAFAFVTLFALSPAHADEQAHGHDHEHEPAHHDDHGEQHGSLGTHEHGVAHLNVAIEGGSVAVALASPAINLLGFEHQAHDEQEQARVAAVRGLLEQPLSWLGLSEDATCSVSEQTLTGAVLGYNHPGYGDRTQTTAPAQDDGHSDIRAEYQLDCTGAAIDELDLAAFFETFPQTEKLQVQAIGPNGQHAAELTADNPRLPL